MRCEIRAAQILTSDALRDIANNNRFEFKYSLMLKYIREIQSKAGKTPAYLHSDRGGEFTSAYLRLQLDLLGVSVEQGPANSPQTNGLSECFNQTLILKIRCLLAQSSVPITFWDEAARFASMLINNLPSKALKWNSPTNVLKRIL